MGIMQRILVPVSAEEDEGELVCKYLAGMGNVGTKSAVVTHVIDPSGEEPPVMAQTIDMQRAHFTELLAPAKDAGIDTEVRVLTGIPGEELAQLATTEGFSGLVLGAHGRTEWAKVFAGSLSTELLNEVRKPMMFVRYDLLRYVKDPAQLSRDFPQTIIMACDFSAGSSMAVLSLKDMGIPKIGRLFMVHVLNPALSGEEREKAEAGAAYQLKNEAEILKAAGINAHVVIRQGDPIRELLDEVDDRHATGVIMGARGRSLLTAAMLGSKSGAMVEVAPCPVIVVP